MDITSLVAGTLSADSNNATYSCTLTNTWSGTNHPIGYDSVRNSAHWSPPVLVAHNEEYELWAPEGMASPGVENVAEIGATNVLEDELLLAASSQTTTDGTGTVAQFVVGVNQFNALDPPQTLEDITLTADFPLLSTISMVAPSPDWFSGFSGFSPISDAGLWYESFAIATGPYDAGTETGDTYTINNTPEAEQLPITQLTADTVPASGILLDPSQTTVLPVATWSCVLQPPTTTTVVTVVVADDESSPPEQPQTDPDPDPEGENDTGTVIDDESPDQEIIPVVVEDPEPDPRPPAPEDPPVPDLEDDNNNDNNDNDPAVCGRYFSDCVQDDQCCSGACDRKKCAGRSRGNGRSESLRISNTSGAVMGGSAGRSRRFGMNRQLQLQLGTAPEPVLSDGDEQPKAATGGRLLRGGVR